MRPVRSLATWLLVVTLAAPGCALGVNGPDPGRPRDEVPQCDTGKGAVMLDGVAAALLGLGGIAALGDDSGTGAALILSSALFTASAYRGNSAANECREAFDQYAQQASRPMPQVADRPRPVVKKKAVAPTVVPKPQDVRLPEPEPVADEQLAETPPQVPPPYQAPRPKDPPKQKPAAKPADDDDWSAFWREAP